MARADAEYHLPLILAVAEQSLCLPSMLARLRAHPGSSDGHIRDIHRPRLYFNETQVSAHLAPNGALALIMALKAILLDDDNVQHLVIGLSRANVDSLLQGEVFVLPRGVVPKLTDDSDIVRLFAETDEEIGQRFPPKLRPV